MERRSWQMMKIGRGGVGDKVSDVFRPLRPPDQW